MAYENKTQNKDTTKKLIDKIFFNNIFFAGEDAHVPQLFSRARTPTYHNFFRGRGRPRTTTKNYQSDNTALTIASASKPQSDISCGTGP